MDPRAHHLESEAEIYVLCLVALIGILLLLFWISPLDRKMIPAQGFFPDENGGAYSLSYLLAIFVLFFLACIAIESAQILVAKTGTVYASFAAARTAVVHLPEGSSSNVRELAKQSAVRAFTPFSRGLADIEIDNTEIAESPDANAYCSAYFDFANTNDKVAKVYLKRKFYNAEKRITISFIDEDSEKWDAKFFVQLDYKYPLMFPFLGKLLGKQVGDKVYRPIRTTTSLPKESPQNKNQTLGINYK